MQTRKYNFSRRRTMKTSNVRRFKTPSRYPKRFAKKSRQMQYKRYCPSTANPFLERVKTTYKIQSLFSGNIMPQRTFRRREK